jgi:hypothetical protein
MIIGHVEILRFIASTKIVIRESQALF